MGERTIDLTASADTGQFVDSAQLTAGTLTSAHASKTNNGPSVPKFTYSQIAIHRSNENTSNRIAILAEGNILTTHGIAWDGTFPIDSDMLLVLTIQGYTDDVVRMNATIVDPKTGASGFPRDP